MHQSQLVVWRGPGVGELSHLLWINLEGYHRRNLFSLFNFLFITANVNITYAPGAFDIYCRALIASTDAAFSINCLYFHTFFIIWMLCQFTCVFLILYLLYNPIFYICIFCDDGGNQCKFNKWKGLLFKWQITIQENYDKFGSNGEGGNRSENEIWIYKTTANSLSPSLSIFSLILFLSILFVSPLEWGVALYPALPCHACHYANVE